MSKTRNLSGVLIALLLSNSVAVADHTRHGLVTGHDLLVACEPLLSPAAPKQTPATSRCRDYLSGFYRAVVHLKDNDCVSDVQELSWRAEVECLRNVPERLSFDQLLPIVVEYGREHPDVLNEPPAELVKAALSAAFP